MGDVVPIFAFMVPIVMFICLFAFLAVGSITGDRRKQEEARAKYEFLKKMAESGNFDVQKYAEFEQTERRFWRERRIENLKLGGLILVGIGVALSVFLFSVAHGEEAPPTALGLMPMAVGGALFLAAWMMSRSDRAAGPKAP